MSSILIGSLTRGYMSNKIRLWLDDIRDPARFGRTGWVWVKTYEAAIEAFQKYDVIQASLDHDLSFRATIGSFDGEKTGYDVVCWMEERNIFPVEGVHIHSANPSGSKRMYDGLRAICRRSGLDERLVTVWPADMNRPPRPTDDPFNLFHDD